MPVTNMAASIWEVLASAAGVLLAQEYKSLCCLEYPELGMEAVWMMEVENLPAFILVDDKGNNALVIRPWQTSLRQLPAGH